jgi:hypothetical protein
MRIKEKFAKKLLVEGSDDQHVVWALCEKFNLEETFDVIDCEGIGKLNEQIPVRFKQSGIASLGIVTDADTEIKNRWASLKGLLSAQGFTVPDDLPSKGLILANDANIKVGVWMMPNNNLNGMLEDFIPFLIPQEDPGTPMGLSITKRYLSTDEKTCLLFVKWLNELFNQ